MALPGLQYPGTLEMQSDAGAKRSAQLVSITALIVCGGVPSDMFVVYAK